MNMLKRHCWVAFFLLSLHQCYSFGLFSAIAGIGQSGQARVDVRAKLWERLVFMRGMRENVKLDIVKTIAEQNLHCKTSVQYKELDKKFVELLHTEDEIILEMERIVKEMTKKKIFSRPVCNLRPPYIHEA